jgi:NAD(P)-dependent dehydrogenase (short-subunit alcohol dehydrogenase family)
VPIRTTFNGRIALVTGANRGLGLEISRQLLERGLRVALSGRDLEAVEQARRGLGNLAKDAVAVRLDVTDPQSIMEAQSQIAEQLGPVDVLVNSAAILLYEDADLFDIPADAFRSTFDTNVLGVIETCRVFVPPMAERGFGRVVNVSSGAGQFARMSTYAPAYSMSKTALNAFTVILAETYREKGVLANAADPGWVRTDMGGADAPRSVEKGAETPVWLATLPDDGPTGGFFNNRRPVPW